MSLTTILGEIWRFIKENILRIVIATVIFAVISVLCIQFLLPRFDRALMDDEADQLTISQEQYKQSTDYLADIYAVEPAEFDLFVQIGDGSTFGNSFIYDEFFSRPDIVEKVEERSGVSFNETLASEKRLNIKKDADYRGSIASIKNSSTDMMTVRIQVGQTAEENLKVAQVYQELVESNDLPFAKNLTTTIMRNTESGEMLDEDNQMMVSSPEILSGLNSVTIEGGSSTSQLGLFTVISLILGFIFVTAVLFIIQLFKKKISYAFQYSWDFKDTHVIYRPSQTDLSLENVIQYPALDKRIVVTQDDATTLNTLIKVSKAPEEIVLLIKAGYTEKDWYNEQYHLAEVLGSQIKIVQVNPA